MSATATHMPLTIDRSTAQYAPPDEVRVIRTEAAGLPPLARLQAAMDDVMGPHDSITIGATMHVSRFGGEWQDATFRVNATLILDGGGYRLIDAVSEADLVRQVEAHVAVRLAQRKAV